MRIAIGKRDTDVAREAAALVLLNDSFASMVAAIRQGWRIDSSIRKAVRFTFAVAWLRQLIGLALPRSRRAVGGSRPAVVVPDLAETGEADTWCLPEHHRLTQDSPCAPQTCLGQIENGTQGL